jgi:hypothetical protein
MCHTPPGGSCTSPGCDQVTCSGSTSNVSCNLQLQCTPSAPCEVDCTSTAQPMMPPPPVVCGGHTIQCPTDQPCKVVCSGPGACVGATVKCGKGPCSLECDNGACSPDTMLECGSDNCSLTCNNSGGPDASHIVTDQTSSCSKPTACMMPMASAGSG